MTFDYCVFLIIGSKMESKTARFGVICVNLSLFKPEVKFILFGSEKNSHNAISIANPKPVH